MRNKRTLNRGLQITIQSLKINLLAPSFTQQGDSFALAREGKPKKTLGKRFLLDN